MDQPLKKNKTKKKILGISIAIIVILALGWFVFNVSDYKSLEVDSSQIQVAEVSRTSFEEGIMITGEIVPNQQTFIDAIESGTVQNTYAKSGDQISKGDTIVLLDNSDLRLEVLQRESQLLEQLNTQRQTRILLNQNDLSQKQQIEEVNYQLDIQKQRYQRNKQLYDKGVISAEDYEEIKKRYDYLQKRQDILEEVYQTDSLARSTQLQQIDNSELRLSQNLIAVQEILGKLCITSPADGKLSDFNLYNGERVEESQRIAVVYNIDPPKIEAEIDELYINDIKEGLRGDLIINDTIRKVVLEKKIPNVENGNFRVVLSFNDSTVTDFYNGQAVRIKLNLSKSRKSLVIPKGRFYSNTGGQWVFVLNEGKAYKREIKLGQQNNRFYEVLEGLNQGEKVIISNYDKYMNYNQLIIDKS